MKLLTLLSFICGSFYFRFHRRSVGSGGLAACIPATNHTARLTSRLGKTGKLAKTGKVREIRCGPAFSIFRVALGENYRTLSAKWGAE
jgi:hypothetical protein